MPKRSEQFYFQTEMTDVTAKRSLQSLEYYDGKTNQGLIDLQSAGRSLTYYNLATHKVRIVLPNKGEVLFLFIFQIYHN